MNGEQQHNLSEAGVVRRKQMLNQLKRSVSDNHRRIKMRRLAGVFSVLFAATLLTVWQFAKPNWKNTVVDDQGRHQDPSTSDRHDTLPFLAAGSPKKVRPPVLEFELVSGDEILQRLNEVGQPSVLAEIDSEWVAIPLSRIAHSQ